MIDKNEAKLIATKPNGMKYENKYPCFSFAIAADANSLTPFVPIGSRLNHFERFSIRFYLRHDLHTSIVSVSAVFDFVLIFNFS